MTEIIAKIKYLISPFFIMRYTNHSDIKKMIRKYKFKGKVLDVGCGEQPYKKLFRFSKYQGIDFAPTENSSYYNSFRYSHQPNYYFEKNYQAKFILQFKDHSFDHAVSFQVLEHHKKPEIMINELFRVIKPGGYILLSIPFIGALHGIPHDYQRFTEFAIQDRVKPFGEITEIVRQGSLLGTISLMINETIFVFGTKNKKNLFISLFIYPPFLLFSYCAMILDKMFPSERIFYNYLFLLRKNL